MRLERTPGMRGVWQYMLLACLLACGSLLKADALDGTLEVRSAYVTVDNGVYGLNARVAYPLNDEIRVALKDGVSLNFDFEATVQKLRRYWTNSTIVDITLHRELSWHEVTERYVVRDASRGEQGSYSTLDQALQAVGSVDAWPIVVEPQLEPNANYEVGVRASVRRGNLTSALRSLIWWSDSWQRSSAWYTWSLPR